MISQYYKKHLLSQLHNLRQGHIFVQDYVAIFEDLTSRNDVREYCSETITKFVWDSKPKIRCAMITSSYDLDTVEETFDVALKIDLTFKMLVNAKADVLSVKDMNILIISAPQRVNMLELCPVMKLTTWRLWRMSTFLLRLLV